MAISQFAEDRVRARIAELEAENARLRELLRWRKTSEEPPKRGQEVLAAGKRPGGGIWVFQVAVDLGSVWEYGGRVQITQAPPIWRPLSPLPGDTTGGEE